MSESEVQLHFPTLFCSAAPALRCNSLCRLYIVVCFVQHGILLISMCVYVFHVCIYHCFYSCQNILCDLSQFSLL